MTLGERFDAAVGAPFRMQPGLRRLPPGAPQLTPARPGSKHQREKLAVLSAFPGLALAEVPGFDPGPALDALCAHAAREHPDAFAWDGERAIAHHLAAAVHGGTRGPVERLGSGAFGLGDEITRCLEGLPPRWRRAGLIALAFEEDFAVIDARDGRVPWLAVALPSHWAPERKVGLHFTEVHAPVADNTLLLRAADALIRLATGNERWERFVWTVTDHPRLHAHPAHVADERWPGGRVEPAWWRHERQTFIPLPGGQQAVFTIHVGVAPLDAAVDTPERAARLHDAIASMSEAVLRYRGLDRVREPLLARLQARGAARPTSAPT